MTDRLLYMLLRGLVGTLQCLPYRSRIAFIATLLRLFGKLRPRYERFALRNLRLAFPDESDDYHQEILRKMTYSFAQVFVDFIRIPKLTAEWARTHVSFPRQDEFRDLRREAQAQGKGILLVSGHLGSFELLPFCMASMFEPMAFVARTHRQKAIDDWWNGIRCRQGNILIPRKGALKGILRHLKAGTDVGLLFDQNVSRPNSVFVDWFGFPAATTKGLGLAAVRLEVPVLLFAIRSTGVDDYEIDMEVVETSDVYTSQTIGSEEKISIITQRAATMYETMIRRDPGAWFWMHRRWKTRPSESDPSFYDPNALEELKVQA